jgi:hypothetical protein
VIDAPWSIPEEKGYRMARLRFGSSRWGRRNEPFNQNEVYVAADTPAKKVLVGVVMLLAGGYIFYTGELSIGEYSDFELTGTPALFLGGLLVLAGCYLTVMNAFKGE